MASEISINGKSGRNINSGAPHRCACIISAAWRRKHGGMQNIAESGEGDIEKKIAKISAKQALAKQRAKKAWYAISGGIASAEIKKAHRAIAPQHRKESGENIAAANGIISTVSIRNKSEESAKRKKHNASKKKSSANIRKHRLK